MKKFFLAGALLASLATSSVAGVYSGKIIKMQAEDDGKPYNTIYLDLDIIDSICESSNSANRFTLISDFQKRVALAAMLADKRVVVATNGQCNAKIEGINSLIIYVD